MSWFDKQYRLLRKMTRDRNILPPPSSERRKSPQYWRWFLPPMLLASLGLHGLVLFTPVAPSEDDLVPPPDAEEDGIALTKIDAPKTRVAPSVPSTPPGTATSATAPPATANTAGTPIRSSSIGATSPEASTPPTPQRNSLGVPPLTPTQRASNPVVPPPPTGIAVTNSANTSDPASATKPEPLKEYFEVFKGYRGQTITQETAAQSRQSWLDAIAELGTAYANLEPKPLDGLDKIPYETKVCLPEAPLPAQFLVLVEPEGTLYSDTQKLQTTGYVKFDLAAESLIKKHEYPSVSAPEAYLVEVAVDYEETNCQQPQDVADLPAAYLPLLDDYSPDNPTSIRAAKAARDSWFEALVEAGDLTAPQADDFEVPVAEDFDAEVDYGFDLCLPVAPEEAWWGVLVNPDGTLQEEPEALRSTGYSTFDDRAKALVEAFDFPAGDSPQAYVVVVPVDYNDTNCKQPAAKTAGSETTSASNPDSSTPEASVDTPADASQDTAIAFDPNVQEQLIEKGQQALGSSPAGLLNSDPGLANGAIEIRWPDDIDQEAFLDRLDPELGPVPVDGAADAYVLTRSADSATEEIASLYGVEDLTAREDYQGAPLYELQEQGVPQLFVSVIGVGTGNSSTLVVVWPSDPHQASEETVDNSPESAAQPSESSTTEIPSSPRTEELAPNTLDIEETTPESSSESEERLDAPSEAENPPAINPRGLGMLLLEVLTQR
ncbi:MAG: hypothetical protein AAGE59_11190 [Cyanobacteria bacterium P01_F01_bin.86]